MFSEKQIEIIKAFKSNPIVTDMGTYYRMTYAEIMKISAPAFWGLKARGYFIMSDYHNGQTYTMSTKGMKETEHIIPDTATTQERCPQCGTYFYVGFDCKRCAI